MFRYLKKEIPVWILGFLTFLAFLNAFNGVLMWILNGYDFYVEPYYIVQFTGRIPVTLYFGLSVAIAFILLGCTTFVAFRNPRHDEMLSVLNSHFAANKRALQGGLAANKKSIETIEADLSNKIETQKGVNEKFFETLTASLQNIRKETLNTFEKQEKGLQQVSQELNSAIETSINGVKEELLGEFAKQEKAASGIEQSNKTIEKAITELADMKTRLESLETILTLPKPKITGQSNPRDIKGVGQILKEELEAMGITNAGQVLSADTAVIADKTRLTRETAGRLQGTMQLLMIPGIDETDVELLEKVGVTNSRELSEQNPYELHSKLLDVSRTYIEENKIVESEKPTLEEVLSWVKLAKS